MRQKHEQQTEFDMNVSKGKRSNGFSLEHLPRCEPSTNPSVIKFNKRSTLKPAPKPEHQLVDVVLVAGAGTARKKQSNSEIQNAK